MKKEEKEEKNHLGFPKSKALFSKHFQVNYYSIFALLKWVLIYGSGYCKRRKLRVVHLIIYACTIYFMSFPCSLSLTYTEEIAELPYR